jgi:hypothetical protein
MVVSYMDMDRHKGLGWERKRGRSASPEERFPLPLPKIITV